MSRASTVTPKNIERLSPLQGKDLARSKVALWRGDITRLGFDAIVNAANESLLGGGGVDGAIHAAAGKRLLKECMKLNGCKTGEAKITKGYKLPAKHVIHTVGPIGENQELLLNCYKNSLDMMLSENLRTIAFPCISTGIYGYPNYPAAKVALSTASNWLKTNHKSVDLIVFCLFLPIDVQIYKELADKYFPTRSESENQQGKHQDLSDNEQASSSVDPLLKDEIIGDNHDIGHNRSAEECQAELSPIPTGSAKTNVESKEQKDIALASNMEETELTTEDTHQNNSSGKRNRCDEENECRSAENRQAELSPIPTGPATTNVERKEQEDIALASTMEETKLTTEDTHQNNRSGKRIRCDEENDCRRGEDRQVESSPIPTGSATMNVESKEQEDATLASTMEETQLITEDTLQNKSSEKRSSDEENEKEKEDPFVLSEEFRREWIKRFESAEVETFGKVKQTDTESWATGDATYPMLKLVGGLDVSYHVTKPDTVCVSLVVLSFPDLEVVYEDSTIETISVPYIPSYLGYREADHFQKKINIAAKAGFAPQISLVDGNGILHPRKFGSAVLVGVNSGVPTIGVAKNLLVMENFGIERDEKHNAQIAELSGKGSAFDMVTNDGQTLGKALRTSEGSKRPVYVSIGHRCSLDTAVGVTLACCKFRVPEPIRQADHLSRMFLQKAFKEDYEKYHAKK